MKFSVINIAAVMVPATVLLTMMSVPTAGIVLHAGGEPDLMQWQERPSSAVIGRWGYNASCVVVSRNCVVTTRHQGHYGGMPIRVDGRAYSVGRMWNHAEADLRVVKLVGADFAEYCEIYDGRDEAGQSIVIGGFGLGRGQSLISQNMTYGYEWEESSNSVLRMGSNRIDGTADGQVLGPYRSDLVNADFDGLGRGFATVYECTAGDYDSGGGWFINDGGVWKVAGLTRGVESHYEVGHEDDPNYLLEESWFASRNNPSFPDPDHFDAVRLSSYTTWLESTLELTRAGDINADGAIDMADLSLFGLYWGRDDCGSYGFCAGADLDGNGRVDYADLADFLESWLGGDEL